jgi:hypothetical protein
VTRLYGRDGAASVVLRDAVLVFEGQTAVAIRGATDRDPSRLLSRKQPDEQQPGMFDCSREHVALALVADPRFGATVNDIVVEFGSSR